MSALDQLLRRFVHRLGGGRPEGPAPERDLSIRSPELRGTDRMAVERLSIAVQGNLVGLIASEYREISLTLREVADALGEQAQGAAEAGLDDAGEAA